MKKITSVILIASLFAASFSCQEQETYSDEVPLDIISKLQAAGFNTGEGLSKYQDGYMIEYDIFLTRAQIEELKPAVLIGDNPTEEHYRSTNLLSTQSTVRGYNVVWVQIDPAFDSYIQDALNAALARYNVTDMKLSFMRAAWGANLGVKEIRIESFYDPGLILGYSAGFPANGRPASPIRLNTKYFNGTTQRADAITVIAHEIGHAIGLRHTDYMNRDFSCNNGAGMEADPNGVGAVHIPGTPTGPELGSYMLACSDGTDRPFTANDQIALETIYPQ